MVYGLSLETSVSLFHGPVGLCFKKIRALFDAIPQSPATEVCSWDHEALRYVLFPIPLRADVTHRFGGELCAGGDDGVRKQDFW